MITRASIYLSLVALGVTLALLLGGCAAPQLLKGSGVPADAPGGYLTECVQHPALENCK